MLRNPKIQKENISSMALTDDWTEKKISRDKNKNEKTKKEFPLGY